MVGGRKTQRYAAASQLGSTEMSSRRTIPQAHNAEYTANLDLIGTVATARGSSVFGLYFALEAPVNEDGRVLGDRRDTGRLEEEAMFGEGKDETAVDRSRERRDADPCWELV